MNERTTNTHIHYTLKHNTHHNLIHTLTSHSRNTPYQSCSFLSPPSSPHSLLLNPPSTSPPHPPRHPLSQAFYDLATPKYDLIDFPSRAAKGDPPIPTQLYILTFSFSLARYRVVPPPLLVLYINPSDFSLARYRVVPPPPLLVLYINPSDIPLALFLFM